MKKEKKTIQITKNKEVILVNLQKALSILILLENELEIQNSDGIGSNATKVVHDILKSIQQDL